MDGWLCGDCKSLNTPRAKRCYRCNVPRDYGERKPEDQLQTIVRSGLGSTPAAGPIPGPTPTAAGPLPPGAPMVPPGPPSFAASGRPRPAISDARSSRGRSRVLVVLLALTTAISAVSTVVFMARGGSMGLLLALLRGDTGSLGAIAGVGLVSGLFTIVTAIAWFIWFDRVLRNVPPLTGQWPDTGRAAAIGWWFVPVVGFIKAPRIVGDVYHRLSVRGTPGLWLLALWALCWIGGTIAPSIAVRVAAFLPVGVEVYLQLADLISLLGQASYIGAGVFAIALVMAIEKASQVRRTGGGAALEVSTGTAERGASFEAALRAAAEANAVAKVEKHGVASPTAAPYRTSRWPGRRGSAPAEALLAEAAVPDPAPLVPAPGQNAVPPPGLTRSAARPAAAVPAGAPSIPVTDDDMPVLRPVMRPPAYAGDRSAIARPEGPAGAHAAGARGGTFARDIPVIPLIPLDPEGEVLVEGFRPKRGWTLRLPRWALGLAALVAVLAVAATVLLAGTLGSAPSGGRSAGGDSGTARAEGLSSPAPSAVTTAATPAPAASAPVASAPAVSAPSVAPVVAATGAPASPAASPTPSPAPTPSPTPEPTPEPWIAARERLVADTFSEDWRGRMDLEGTLKVGDRKPATWALAVARDGNDEWARRKVTDPAAGLNQTTEQVFTRRTTWVREGREPWASRDRSFGDQPTEALFGVRSVDDLTFLEASKEDGKVRFRFRIEEASDLLALGYLRTLGLGPLDRTEATVVTDADGVPVRAELSYAGTLRGAKARLTVEIRYKEVGGAFHIASPKDGGPVVDD